MSSKLTKEHTSLSGKEILQDLTQQLWCHESTPLNAKRVLAFFNEYVEQVASILNRFANASEDKLFQLDTRLRGLEISLQLLEAKVSSAEMPGSTTAGTTAVTAGTTSTATAGIASAVSDGGEYTGPQGTTGLFNAVSSACADVTSEQHAASAAAAPCPDVVEDAGATQRDVTVRQSEPYRKYFKMLTIGVPEPAVRLKMRQDGVSPDMLQQGDVPLSQVQPIHTDQ